PPVRRLYVWDQDLFPSHWAAPSAASERDAFVLMDVAPTGTAELDVGLESHLLVRWRDGVCAEVSVDLDVELCVQVSEGDLLYDDPSFRLYIDDMLAPLDGEGVGCAATRVGDSLVTQVWMTETSAREHTDLFSVATPGEHRVEIARHLLDTASGAVLWPSVFGPRVVSVRGLAEAMGVRNGDVVVAVNGQSVAGEPMAEVAEHLDGLHSSVVLTLDRADVELDITILFDEVDD
ncbi:MAG: hypothetical protein CL927_04330, partial [Deltaproteobacteria bacterium]|nr:hypothetical protein [Deltaproteobacteria bacterium]HCH66279.1 hypothetical protein [Deltaproteobacteria bacterium]